MFLKKWSSGKPVISCTYYKNGSLKSLTDVSGKTLHYAYHQDEQGSTAYITGNAGAAENCYAYDAFGNLLESRETIENCILYTGQQYDQETGQYYLRARFYNPVTIFNFR